MGEVGRLVAKSDQLAQVCDQLSDAEYVCVDTEFIRRTTFWPELCLIQLGSPDAGDGDIVLVDALARGLDLSPLYRLMASPEVVKVFHAAEQDIEIFYHYGEVIPWPLFDTQIAAGFCGFGSSVGYDKLVKQVTGAIIDKTAQVSDWSRRPLRSKQLAYAEDDVRYLPQVYERLWRDLGKHSRTDWIETEMAAICDPRRYDVDPQQAWKRIKSKGKSPHFLAVLREVAAWREVEAQRTNRPRSWVLSDHYLVKLAELQPTTTQELADLPAPAGRKTRASTVPSAVLKAVQRGLDCPPEERPARRPRGVMPDVALSAMLGVYLKSLTAAKGVADSLVADSSDLDRLSVEDHPDIPLLSGWRKREFGDELMRLKRGEIALSVRKGKVVAVPATKQE